MNNDELQNRIMSIPPENMHKFSVDLLKLIDLAHTKEYDNYEL